MQEILDPVQNAGEGNGLAPIGHVVNVESVVPVTVNVTTTITFEGGYSWLNLQGSIMEAINSYLLELRKSWADSSFTVVRVSQIEARILNVTGVADISNTKLNNSTDNLILEKYQIPVMGGVSA